MQVITVRHCQRSVSDWHVLMEISGILLHNFSPLKKNGEKREATKVLLC